MGFLAAWCFLSRGLGLVWPLAYGLLFGATDEIHQLWVPLRSCSLADWFADAAGTFLGVGTYLVIMAKLNSTKAKRAVSDTKITDSLELT